MASTDDVVVAPAWQSPIILHAIVRFGEAGKIQTAWSADIQLCRVGFITQMFRTRVADNLPPTGWAAPCSIILQKEAVPSRCRLRQVDKGEGMGEMGRE